MHYRSMNLEQAKKILAENKMMLYRQFSLKNIMIFGSFARGEQKKDSDIDILAEFEKTPGLFTMVRAEEQISKLLGRKVDLVTPKSLKPLIAKQALKEAVAV